MKLDSVVLRMDAIETAALAFFTTRKVQRSLLQSFTEHAESDIAKGVIMMVSQGEGNYHNGQGMIAKEGTQNIRFICHLKVDEKTQAQVDVEKAEGALIEEIKAFVRAGVTGMTLVLSKVTQSQQLAYPYGFVVADIQAEPPNQTTY